jgi:hypothetical protein
MSAWFLKMLGVEADGAEVSGVSVAVQGGVDWGWIILLGVALAVVTFVSYRWLPAEVSRFRRMMLTGLRLVFFALLVLLILMPVVRFDLKRQERMSLLVLIDASESMALAEPRTDPLDVRRAAMALGVIEPGAGGDFSDDFLAEFKRKPRIELLRGALTNSHYNLLPQLSGRFNLAPFTFGQTVDKVGGGNATSTDWVASLNAVSPVTAIGSSVTEALHAQREIRYQSREQLGGSVAGVFLATDGANNAGLKPGELVARLQREGVPLYIYGVGITDPRDIRLVSLAAPDAAFVEDTIAIQVRVRSQGLAGKPAEMKLSIDGASVTNRTITFDPDGDQLINLSYTPMQPGEFKLEVSIDPRDDETEPGNNRLRQRLRVVDSRISVLLVDQTPRWEYRYLSAMLKRDRRVDLRILLFEGDDSISSTLRDDSDSPYLKEFPDSEALRDYDVVILGDVDRGRLDGPAGGLELLRKFVAEQGGSLVVLAGKQNCPARYVGTELDAMLPVVLSSSPVLDREDVYGDREIIIERTLRGRGSAMLRLSDEDEENEKIWDELPGIFWIAEVERAKPTAQVLMVRADKAVENSRDLKPVLALHTFGAGHVMYVGTDNFWRWRRNAGDRHHTRLWSQIVQRMALPRLMGFSRDVQLTLDRRTYRTGDRVRVKARLFNRDDLPVNGLQLVYRQQDGSGEQVVDLQADSDSPGAYSGEFLAPKAGQFELNLRDPDGPRDTLEQEKRFFAVREFNLEKTRTAMNESLLREMAAQTGGAFFREENLHELPAAIPDRTRETVVRMERELWSSWIYFLLLLIVITIEWVIRKMSYLK